MQYLFDIHCLIVCFKWMLFTELSMSARVRDAPGVSWGYPQSSRLKTYPFEQGVPRFWYKLVVDVPVPVPVEATTPELPWDLQNIAVVTSVARPVVSSPTQAIHLGSLRAAPAHHQAQPLWRAGTMSMGSNICSAATSTKEIQSASPTTP
jgi:hypothetical protein